MQIKHFYNKTAHVYDLRQNNPSTKWLRKHEKKIIKKYAKGKVLDIGCGTGYHLHNLKKIGFSENDIAGLDISPCMIGEARKKVNCRFVLGDAESMYFHDKSFDTVLCMFSTLNIMDVEKALSEMHRVLKDDGCLILSVSSVWDKEYKHFFKRLGESNIKKKTLHLHKHHIDCRLFTKNALKKTLKQHGFEPIFFKGLFVFQRPFWGRFRDFSGLQKARLFLGDMLNIFGRAGSVYLMVCKRISIGC